jgi:hypothetical protein
MRDCGRDRNGLRQRTRIACPPSRVGVGTDPYGRPDHVHPGRGMPSRLMRAGRQENCTHDVGQPRGILGTPSRDVRPACAWCPRISTRRAGMEARALHQNTPPNRVGVGTDPYGRPDHVHPGRGMPSRLMRGGRQESCTHDVDQPRGILGTPSRNVRPDCAWCPRISLSVPGRARGIVPLRYNQ